MQWFDLARRQHGVISAAQLRACGLSRHQIDSLRTKGLLRPDRCRGVYRSSTVHSTGMTEAWSAVLSARAVLSHLSAAVLWDIDVPTDGLVHVIAPGRRKTAMPDGVRVHRVYLPEDGSTQRYGVPITAQVRTVLDCLGVLGRSDARLLFDRSLQRRWIELADVENRLREESGRAGNVQPRRLLSEATMGDSEAERRLHRLLRRGGITGWCANYPVAGYFADVAFPGARLIVEVDGWAYHSDVSRFRADRRRQNALANAGWSMLRFTWADLMEQPDEVIRTIRIRLEQLAI